MVSSSEHESYPAPRIVGIDDWAWRKGQRYGTIVCDLERNRVLDLLPERNADVVAEWLARHPGVEIIARDRAGVYAEGARRGAPDAAQIADRWHLLANLGEALRLAVGRHRKAVRLAGVAAMNEIATGDHELPEHPSQKPTSLQLLRHQRKLQRRDLYEEVMRLRDAGITSARQIAPQVGMSVRTIERWLTNRGAASPQLVPGIASSSQSLGKMIVLSRSHLAFRLCWRFCRDRIDVERVASSFGLRGIDRRTAKWRSGEQSARASIRNDDQIADEALGHEIPLRAVEIGKRIDARNQRPDAFFLDIADETPEVRPAALT
ncbi:hypothetical protein B0E45_04980 [Sinorhizobium sp. A49]|nr:hypothetical protein B0E45_04980 [Sinorhizobium sp. A49]